MATKRYSDTFKQEVVERVQSGASVREVAEQTGVSTHSVRAWVTAAEVATYDRAPTPQEHAEIRRLKKELRDAQMEREILKKATAFFASQRR